MSRARLWIKDAVPNGGRQPFNESPPSFLKFIFERHLTPCRPSRGNTLSHGARHCFLSQRSKRKGPRSDRQGQVDPKWRPKAFNHAVIPQTASLAPGQSSLPLYGWSFLSGGHRGAHSEGAWLMRVTDAVTVIGYPWHGCRGKAWCSHRHCRFFKVSEAARRTANAKRGNVASTINKNPSRSGDAFGWGDRSPEKERPPIARKLCPAILPIVVPNCRSGIISAMDKSAYLNCLSGAGVVQHLRPRASRPRPSPLISTPASDIESRTLSAASSG